MPGQLKKEFPMTAKYIEQAKADDPAGATCGWCGKANDLADDCGWFVIAPNMPLDATTGYACRACYNGPLGQAHRAYFGVGER
jgi:hypothetical protein